MFIHIQVHLNKSTDNSSLAVVVLPLFFFFNSCMESTDGKRMIKKYEEMMDILERLVISHEAYK